MDKKEVGILTFHRALNYGAVLQAYALKAVCDEMGYETHIIDYLFDGINEEIAPFKHFMNSNKNPRAFISLGISMTSYLGDKKRERAFKEFRKKYLNESLCCSNSKDIEGLDYDYYISGSDQIWNYNITGKKFDPVFFLRKPTNGNKIIYAASSQDVPFPLDMELKFQDILNSTEAFIGIREKKLRDYVAKLTGRKYPVVLDPTLLAGRELMDRIPTRQIKDIKYILLYQIDRNPYSDIDVKSLEKKFKCPVYTLSVPRIGNAHGRKGDCGPEEFLSLLKNAEFLVTNSFHGIALSLVFEKQFYVYENGGVMSRIDGLLDQFALQERKVKMVDDIDVKSKIDYTPVTKKLSELRYESQQFLKDAFNGEDNLSSRVNVSEKELLPIRQRKKADCCGCTACADICPVQAISIKVDNEGFDYPIIDEEKCVHCGKCDKVCSFDLNDKHLDSFALPNAYGFKHKDINTRLSSRSGAAFVGFSDWVLEKGGIVYGAVMQPDFMVKHSRAINKEERDLMKKAKYVQSDTRNIYPQVEKDLEADRYVLFSGTPCQVSGLKAYLKDRRVSEDKLICCDMVCHGVPSPLIWKKYLRYIAQKYKGDIKLANFRDKEFGWDSHYESFVVSGQNKKIVSRDYTDLFYEHIMLRPSCSACPFANVNRVSDLTMADFWGIEKQDQPGFDDNKGISLVLVNTPKGQRVFDDIKNQFVWFQTSIEKCMQPTLIKPSTASPRREEFWIDERGMSFGKLLKKYSKPNSRISRCKLVIKKCMYKLGIRKCP